MKRMAVLAVVAAVCLALVAADYNTVKIADKDFLLKQKKVYNVLYHVSQPSIVLSNLYEEGRSYDIEANIDSYTNTTAVKEFLYLYKYGTLPRGEIFSPYYPQLMKETKALFHLLYYAKDFDSFYKTALWARVHMNEMQFGEAMYTALTRREDTKFINMPPPYEMYPYMFFNSEVLHRAHHAKVFGKHDTKKFENHDIYIIPANYSGWYLSRDFDHEHEINYFTEDIGLNAYYFYLRKMNPIWLKSDEMEQKYRGEEYLYAHFQLLVRYLLERFSNNMGDIGDFDWHDNFYVGYYPTMTYHTGLPFPQRAYFSKFPYYKYKYIKDIQEFETRVAVAIDSGYVKDVNGKEHSIYTPEGLNMLGNIVEGNVDSCNLDFYGSIDTLARKILGFNLEPSTKYQIVPSALEFYSTSMRDPAFYRLYKRIFDLYYNRYKHHQKPYSKNDIVYPGLKIESFTVDKLITFFDQFDTTISNGMLVEDANEAEKMLVRIRQYRLNHKPFSFHFAINADKATKANLRIFLGPKYDVHHKPLDFVDNTKYFYEMDNFIVNLNAGTNKIVRNSQDCFFTIPDPEPSEMYYKKMLNGLDGSESFSYTERVYGFPERLLLPKGKKDGVPIQFFVYVSPIEGEPIYYESRIFGGYKFNNRPFGFPLDRPVHNFHYDGPNMMLSSAHIYHKDTTELNVIY